MARNNTTIDRMVMVKTTMQNNTRRILRKISLNAVGRKLVMVLPAIALVGLSGCGWLKFGGVDYREAQVTEPMQVPEDMDKTAINDLYSIPGWKGDPEFSEDFEVPQAEAFLTKSQSEIRAFKSGNKYWIAVNSSPASAWAKVRHFWELNSISLDREIPYQGDMETAWLSRETGGVSTRDKFRVRVEHGMHENSAEVYIMHLGFPANGEVPNADQLDWSLVKEGDELAVAIMQEIASFLIETEYEAAPASLLAQSFSGAPKSSLGTDAAGKKILLLKLNFERAWEAIGKAIDEAKIVVSDKDRSSGTYYVDYFPDGKGDDKDGAGKLSFLPFVGSKSDDESYKYVVTLKAQSEQIAVAVAADDENVQVDLSEAVLDSIRENLI